MSKLGILLVNLGTPEAPDVKSVRRFLREFLSDPDVIDLPWVARQLILNCFILPFRPQHTAKLYQKIWTAQGSPLLHHSQQFKEKLARELGNDYEVALGMRYGKPSLSAAYASLQHCQKIVVFPLFPQYSVAASGSAIAACKKVIAKAKAEPKVKVISSFYNSPHYIEVMSELIQARRTEFNPDFILFSYHGIPERALEKSGCEKTMCNRIDSCMAQAANVKFCYRAQCQATTELIAKRLQLSAEIYGSGFQSRLGRAQWVRPYTDQMLVELRKRGLKRLLVCCPSFVADCLETLEEINLRLKEEWQALGGEAFMVVPCLNAEEAWVKAAASILTLPQSAC